MNLYKVTRLDSPSYGEYDSMVVAAETEQDAREIHPHINHMQSPNSAGDDDIKVWRGEIKSKYGWFNGQGSWVEYSKINTLNVELIGTASNGVQRGLILSSYLGD